MDGRRASSLEPTGPVRGVLICDISFAIKTVRVCVREGAAEPAPIFPQLPHSVTNLTMDEQHVASNLSKASSRGDGFRLKL